MEFEINYLYDISYLSFQYHLKLKSLITFLFQIYRILDYYFNQTSLYFAVAKGRLEIVKLLLRGEFHFKKLDFS